MAGLSMQIITGFIFLGTVFGSPLQIHHQMTPEERLQVFRTSGTDVPPYEVVEIPSPKVQKRAAYTGHSIKIKAFGEEIEHYLTPLNDMLVTENTPIGEAVFDPTTKNVLIKNASLNMTTVSQYIYENKAFAITLSIKKHRGRREMNGIIGYKNWHVSPMPNRIRRSLNRSGRSGIDDDIDSEHEDKSYHVIYQMPNSNDQNVMTPLFRVQRSERSTKNQIAYPQVFVIVDFNLFKSMNYNMYDTIIYVVAFWNSVDTLYRDLDHPQIKINIAGILVAQDEKALSYIESIHGNKLIAETTLYKKSKWLYKNKDQMPIEFYDVSFTMARFNDMGHLRNGNFRGYVNGFVNGPFACVTLENEKRVMKIGLIRDWGNFQAIRTTAHELGHLLGAVHDGDNNGCRSEDGAILASKSGLINNSPYSHSFSSCSIAAFKKFLSKPEASCLWNKPDPKKPLPRILPGKLISLEAQCSVKEGFTIPYIEEDMCRELKCLNQIGQAITDGRPAADGSSCAENKICLHGFCVDEKRVMKNLPFGNTATYSFNS